MTLIFLRHPPIISAMDHPLDKEAIADILEEIGMLLELQGENPFKTRAYSHAAQTIRMLDQDLGALIDTDALSSIPGIGEALSKKITTLYTTGRLEYLDKLRTTVPEDFLTMIRIRGLGAKKIIQLHKQLNIRTLDELEAACRDDRLLAAKGFGKAMQDKILKGIEQLRRSEGLHLFAHVEPEMAALLSHLQTALADDDSISPTGEYRRLCSVIRDLPLLAASDAHSRIIDHFAAYVKEESVLERTSDRCRIRLDSGIESNLYVVPKDVFSFALHHATGSHAHAEGLRQWAQKKGMFLTENGLTAKGKPVNCRDEEAIFAALGLADIPPELREDTGEIAAAAKGALPRLIERADIRGAFHVHTNMSDGANTLEQLATAAKAAALEYIGIADHSRSAYYAHGLSVEQVVRQIQEIDRLNAADIGVYLFKGIEVEILPDGRLDYDEEILRLFDFVIAAIHSHFSMPEREMTDRISRAMEHPHVTMLAHPTGRLLLSRDPYAVNLAEVIDCAASLGKVLEINAYPDRLDLDWRWCKAAKEKGVLMAINPDVHQASGFDALRYGVNEARRGWLEATDCLNTQSLDAVRQFLVYRKKSKK